MIKGFADKATKEIFDGDAPKGFPTTILAPARRKLRYLDAAVLLTDLKVPPGNKLHPLAHDRTGQHAIWINNQYRLCFYWTDDGVYDVEIIDYH